MSEKWVNLRLACPAYNCNNTTVSDWVHANDGYCSQISNRARIRCSYCCNPSHIKNWLFACDNHRGDYRSTNQTSFQKALALTLLVQDCAEVMAELSSYILNNKHEWS
jgi:hypothetical protein